MRPVWSMWPQVAVLIHLSSALYVILFVMETNPRLPLLPAEIAHSESATKLLPKRQLRRQTTNLRQTARTVWNKWALHFALDGFNAMCLHCYDSCRQCLHFYRLGDWSHCVMSLYFAMIQSTPASFSVGGLPVHFWSNRPLELQLGTQFGPSNPWKYDYSIHIYVLSTTQVAPTKVPWYSVTCSRITSACTITTS